MLASVSFRTGGEVYLFAESAEASVQRLPSKTSVSAMSVTRTIIPMQD
jgi:hypothetical protein